MMKYSKELKIGLFFILIVISSFFMINYLRGEDIFNNEITLYSRYDDVEGLVASAPVFIKGYKAGKVVSVSYDAESYDFLVECSVRKEFQIPSDSKMVIYSVDIMGGKGIRIDLGSSQIPVEDGSSLTPSFELGLMDGLSENISPLLADLSDLLDSLTVAVSAVNRVMSAADSGSIAHIIHNIDNATGSISSLASDIDGSSAELTAFIDNLSQLSFKLSSIADDAEIAVGDISEVTSKLSKAEIDSLVSSLNIFLDGLNDPDGTIGKLMNDGAVYDSVNDLLSDIDSLVCKIQNNPKKYLRLSVF